MSIPMIAEALEALETVSALALEDELSGFALVRSALEAAAQQERDWEAIEAFCHENELFEIAIHFDGDEWVSKVLAADGELLTDETIWDAPTRAEAIAAAAAWCRSQAGWG